MSCVHSRYNHDDEHAHDDPQRLMAALVEATIPGNELITYIKEENVPDIQLNLRQNINKLRIIHKAEVI